MRKYKAAVIGLGNIGLMYDFDEKRNHPSSHSLAYTYSDDFDLVFGIDSEIVKKDYLKQICPTTRFFNTVDEAVEKGYTNDIDVVSVCTPPDTHYKIISELLGRKIGKIIFCEKPIALNVEEAKKIKELVNKSNIKIIPNISRRWNSGLRKVTDCVQNEIYGKLEKINIRYTRGIYNTGSHLFDLLEMWTGSEIESVEALDKTITTAEPEPSFSFFFRMSNGVTGYAEAIDDEHYYMFDIDMFMSEGKIEMRNSGDDIRYYKRTNHHLFSGFMELKEVNHDGNLLSDSCMMNAIDNIAGWIKNGEKVFCSLENAIKPLYIAEALEKSYNLGQVVKVNYE